MNCSWNPYQPPDSDNTTPPVDQPTVLGMPLSVDCCLVARSIPETPKKVETERKTNHRQNSQERIFPFGDATPVPNFRHLERRGGGQSFRWVSNGRLNESQRQHAGN
jgi:hypothetical protein